jgi:magnesium transporter
MITAFACSDQALNRLADRSVEALSPALWIDLLDATPDEIDRVQKATGLDVPTQAEVSEIVQPARQSQWCSVSQHAVGQPVR